MRGAREIWVSLFDKGLHKKGHSKTSFSPFKTSSDPKTRVKTFADFYSGQTFVTSLRLRQHINEIEGIKKTVQSLKFVLHQAREVCRAICKTLNESNKCSRVSPLYPFRK